MRTSPLAHAFDEVDRRLEEGRKSIVVDSVQLLGILCEELSDGRFEMPDEIDTSALEGTDSVEFAVAVQMVRDMVQDRYDAQLIVMQDEYEHNPTAFEPPHYYKRIPVKDGKVQDAWGHTSKAQVDWFLDNVTISDMFDFRRILHKAARLTVRENLTDYARGFYEGDPRASVKDAFKGIAKGIYDAAERAVRPEKTL